VTDQKGFFIYQKDLEGVSKTMYALFQPKSELLDKFLQCVAFGMQNKVEYLLRDVYSGNVAKIQETLRYQGRFTDHSGRTFNCSAFEYAYWAKDTHMCRMLQRYMDEETKAIIAARIDKMEEINLVTGQPLGLAYSQAGEEHRSALFNLTPLKTALRVYVDGIDAWKAAEDWDAIDAAWLNVGLAQRDVTAHVAQEYCNGRRPFYPCPSFDEPTLRYQDLYFYWWSNPDNGEWFPLSKNLNKLGADFAIVRSSGIPLAIGRFEADGLNLCKKEWATHDLIAITSLDETRTRELLSLREHLKTGAISHVCGS